MRLIDADVLKEYLGCDGDNKYSSMIMHEIADRIDEQPTIDAIPAMHGRWVFDRPNHYKCSLCDAMWSGVARFMKFCPNCGAKMDGGAEGV